MLAVGLAHYLTVGAILFVLGVFGIFLNRKNVIVILMSVELILLSVNLNFVAFSAWLDDLTGQVFALLVLTVAAAEAAIGLGHYLTVAAVLFTLGVFGIFLNRKNVIVILMAIELILLAVNINLVAFSTHLNDITGQVFALLVLTVAAAEAAIGLAILVVFFRNRGSIAVEDVSLMRG